MKEKKIGSLISDFPTGELFFQKKKKNGTMSEHVQEPMERARNKFPTLIADSTYAG